MELKDEPLGGGNQFLKALKKEAQKNDSYSENLEDAQLILFNSHHNPIKVLEARKKYSDHIFVHRVDGPMSYRGKNGKRLDQKILIILKKLVSLRRKMKNGNIHLLTIY